MDIAALASICISVVVMIVSVMTFNAAVKERHSKTAAESAEITSSIKFMQDLLEDMSAKIDKMQEDYHESDRRLTELKTFVDTKFLGVDGRIKKLEERVNDIERRNHA